MRFVFLLSMIFMLGQSAVAWAELTVTAAETGLFVRPKMDLESGEFVVSGKREEIQPTKKIVAQLGTKFGIRYSVAGKKETGNRVTLLYLTPGIVDNNGERHDKYVEVKDLRMGAGHHTMAFQITDDYELVPGIWQMMIFEKDRLLVKETFELILKGTEVLSGFEEADTKGVLSDFK